ncbi:hypothetical protein AB0E01_17145 [Nocardia vinacea]|uniref:hypothetical protein n=1 Tax=Nocardia vinacea TaxID=96468 RepID=UPI0033F343A5
MAIEQLPDPARALALITVEFQETIRDVATAAPNLDQFHVIDGMIIPGWSMLALLMVANNQNEPATVDAIRSIHARTRRGGGDLETRFRHRQAQLRDYFVDAKPLTRSLTDELVRGLASCPPHDTQLRRLLTEPRIRIGAEGAVRTKLINAIRDYLKTPAHQPDPPPQGVHREHIDGRWPSSRYDSVRDRHLARVRDLAPDPLKDRDNELDELIAFCRGESQYRWLRAGPRAGKTALLATFVLRAPSDLIVVPFFVMRQLADDHLAFTEALIEQLSLLVSTDYAVADSPPSRDAHRRDLLRRSAERAETVGRRLVLVVDGLDEDIGTPSIASLLPNHSIPSLRVIVSSRRTVKPAVPPQHPLLAAAFELAPSATAGDLQRAAERDLQDLLDGPELGRRIVGLLAAAVGGLTDRDLEHLTGHPPYQIRAVLHGVSGRIFESHRLPTLPVPVNVFAHAALHEETESAFGSHLDQYREQIDRWAQDYRTQQWPTDTPHYLLHGYMYLLKSRNDWRGLAELALDHARNARLLEVTGTDRRALNEISLAQDAWFSSTREDLAMLQLLAVRKSNLTDRNQAVSPALAALWVRFGDYDRAESMARIAGIRSQALSGVAIALARQGEHDRAVRVANTITDGHARTGALSEIAEIVAVTGDLAYAMELATAVYADEGATRWIRQGVIERLAGKVPSEFVLKLLERCSPTDGWIAPELAVLEAQLLSVDGADIFSVLSRIPEDDRLVRALLMLARHRLARRGEIQAAIERADAVDNPHLRASCLAAVARAYAESGANNYARSLLDRAATAIRNVTDPEKPTDPHLDIGIAWVSAHEIDRAIAQVRRITQPRRRVESLASLSRAAHESGQSAAAMAILDEAITIARAELDTEQQDAALVWVSTRLQTTTEHGARLGMHLMIGPFPAGLAEVADTLMDLGYDDHARALIPEITTRLAGTDDPGIRESTRLKLALLVARLGNPLRAIDIARATDTTVFLQPKHFTALIEAIIDGAGTSAALDLIHGFVRSGPKRGTSTTWNKLYTSVAIALTKAGRLAQARDVARMTGDTQYQTMTAMARTLAAANDLESARTLAEQAVISIRTGRQATWNSGQNEACAQFAQALAWLGDYDDAATYATRSDSLWYPNYLALSAVVDIAVSQGHFDSALNVADRIARHNQRLESRAVIAYSLATHGLTDRARQVLDELRASPIDNDDFPIAVLAATARALFAVGEEADAQVAADDAVAIAATATDDKIEYLASAAAAFVETGDIEPITALAHDLGDQTAMALAAIAKAVAETGRNRLARDTALAAAELAMSVHDEDAWQARRPRELRSQALHDAAIALAQAGAIDDGCEVMARMSRLRNRELLSIVGGALAENGKAREAIALAKELRYDTDVMVAVAVGLCSYGALELARLTLAYAMRRSSDWWSTIVALSRIDPAAMRTVAAELKQTPPSPTSSCEA